MLYWSVSKIDVKILAICFGSNSCQIQWDVLLNTIEKKNKKEEEEE